MENLKKRLKSLYMRVDAWSGGILGVFVQTFQNLRAAHVSEAAAGMAYYMFFSLFPLLLAIVAVGGFFLKQEVVYSRAMDFVSEAMPIPQRIVDKNLQRVLELRGSVGIVGLASLLWSATGAFSVLSRHINRAWSQATTRNMLEQRLVALAIIGALIGLLFLSLASTTLVELLPRLQRLKFLERDGGSIYNRMLWKVLSRLIPWFFSFIMFLMLYRWVPNIEVPWKPALWGAALASLAWELAKQGFAWYLSSGLAKYDLVYGSLGTVVALMFWIYIGSWIVFFGAYLSAVVSGQS